MDTVIWHLAGGQWYPVQAVPVDAAESTIAALRTERPAIRFEVNPRRPSVHFLSSTERNYDKV